MRGLRQNLLAFASLGAVACGSAPPSDVGMGGARPSAGGAASGGAATADAGSAAIGGTSVATGGGLSPGGGNTAGSGTGGGASGGRGSGGSAALDCNTEAPPSAPISLLTRSEFNNTVFDLLADDSKPASAFPPENQVEGFKNNAFANQASPLSVEKYLSAAEMLATNAAARIDTLAPCAKSQSQAECGRNFVRAFGAKAFRRPLDDTEAQAFDALFSSVLMNSDYATAFQLTLQALLQSPQFLYRADTLDAPTVETGAVLLGPYQLASRLSYFVTGSMPDSELMDAAAHDALKTDAQVEAQARRLLATSRARDMVREFHHQWLQLDALPAVVRTSANVSYLDAAWFGKDWLESFDRFVDHAYWDVGNISELFTSKRVYVNARLAQLYDVSAPQTGFASAELPDRAGLITQPALLALLAHSDQSAPVLRGVFALERLMCTAVPPPPPNVNTTPPDPDPKATTRERFDVHTKDAKCSGCHNLIDGVGFGFEAYDQFGRYRSQENQIPVDTSGNVLVGDPELSGTFRGASELALRLGASSRVRDCVATSWYRFALGRLESEADTCSLDDVKARFAATRGNFQELFVAITRSVAFRYRAPSGNGGT